jgi:hypothetical protein
MFDVPKSSVDFENPCGRSAMPTEIFRQNGHSASDTHHVLLSGQKLRLQDDNQNKVTLYTNRTASAGSLLESA